MDVSTRDTQSASAPTQSHIIWTAIDVVMAAIALVLALGLVSAVLLQREIPVVLVTVFTSIITYYFGRTARS